MDELPETTRCSHPAHARRTEVFYPGEAGSNAHTIYVTFCNLCDAQLASHNTAGDRRLHNQKP